MRRRGAYFSSAYTVPIVPISGRTAAKSSAVMRMRKEKSGLAKHQGNCVPSHHARRITTQSSHIKNHSHTLIHFLKGKHNCQSAVHRPVSHLDPQTCGLSRHPFSNTTHFNAKLFLRREETAASTCYSLRNTSKAKNRFICSRAKIFPILNSKIFQVRTGLGTNRTCSSNEDDRNSMRSPSEYAMSLESDDLLPEPKRDDDIHACEFLTEFFA